LKVVDIENQYIAIRLQVPDNILDLHCTFDDAVFLCCQNLMASLSNATDASGNPVLGDIGVHLTKEVYTPSSCLP